MKISIGILAYNESSLIGKMLDSLFQQNLFQEPIPDMSVEIIVVPNGCTDDTAIVAQKTLANLLDPTIHTNVTWRVDELKQPGKSNAWNQYVHHLSNPEADYFFLMDSDIELLAPQTLNSAINILNNMPEAWVAVDRPIKNIQFKENKTWLEQLSVLMSSLSGNSNTTIAGKPGWICGQFYCARAEKLRKIILPTSLPTQDAFLYSMIATDGLKSLKNPHRVILADSASHIFEAYTNIGRLLRHEKWLIIGSTINELIYNDLLIHQNKEPNAAALIRKRNEKDSLWLDKLVQEVSSVKGWWLIPRFILIRRFLSLLNKPTGKSIILFPLAFIAFLTDLLLAFQANFDLNRGVAFGYWGKKQSSD